MRSRPGLTRMTDRPSFRWADLRAPRVALILTIACLLVWAFDASAQPGQLDPSFDGDGRVTTAFSGRDRAAAVAVQVDGKIVVAGESFGYRCREQWRHRGRTVPEQRRPRPGLRNRRQSHYRRRWVQGRGDVGGNRRDGRIVVAGFSYANAAVRPAPGGGAIPGRRNIGCRLRCSREGHRRAGPLHFVRPSRLHRGLGPCGRCARTCASARRPDPRGRGLTGSATYWLGAVSLTAIRCP